MRSVILGRSGRATPGEIRQHRRPLDLEKRLHGLLERLDDPVARARGGVEFFMECKVPVAVVSRRIVAAVPRSRLFAHRFDRWQVSASASRSEAIHRSRSWLWNPLV